MSAAEPRTRDDRVLWVRLTHDQSGEPFIIGRWFCGFCYRGIRHCGDTRRYALSVSRSCKKPTEVSL